MAQELTLQTIGRWLWIAFALALAICAAILFLPIALFSDPLLYKIGSALAPEGVEALIQLFLAPDMQESFAGGIFTIIWLVMMAICVAPVTIAAVIGEAARIRAIIWYCGASGLLAGAMPWILRAAQNSRKADTATGSLAHAAELRISLIFLITGIAAGFIYWLTAGRSTGASTRSG